jgi:methanogenesis marker radical SAM protein
MQIVADVGGIPGKDCRGFCKYCYFRKITESHPLGCKNCSPGIIGCETCTEGVAETKNEFIPPFIVATSVQNTIMMGGLKDKDLKINISGGGDVSCYPQLEELTATFHQLDIPMHLGYTSGKGIDDARMASNLISHGVDEVTFTLFSVDAEIRRKWMSDPHPEESLKAAQIFSENIELHAASVIVPGVNDGDVLRETCAKLEEWGAKAMILMRFANYNHQGLILGNEPIIKGVEPHTIQEFEALVREINNDFNLRVTGTPVCDPESEAPFAISMDKNEVFLQFIPEVTGEATIITSKIAAPYIQKIFDRIEADEKVNIYAVEKDIGCLITREDLEAVDLSQLKETVLIPGRAFVHDLEAQEILSRDGVDRLVARGPDKLTVDGEMSNTLTRENVIERELEAFRDLVGAINFFGIQKKE